MCKNNIFHINSTGSWTTGCHEWGFQSEAVENRTLSWGMQDVVAFAVGISGLQSQSWGLTTWIYLFTTPLYCSKAPSRFHYRSGVLWMWIYVCVCTVGVNKKFPFHMHWTAVARVSVLERTGLERTMHVAFHVVTFHSVPFHSCFRSMFY